MVMNPYKYDKKQYGMLDTEDGAQDAGAPPARPEPYKPATQQPKDGPPPRQTFAQMQDLGEARPPMPVQEYGGGMVNVQDDQPPAPQSTPAPAPPPAPSVTAGMAPYASTPAPTKAYPGATNTNQFGGYVSPNGGQFGGNYSADPQAAMTHFSSVSGVDAAKLGLGPSATADDYNYFTKLFGGIASRDPAAIQAAMASGNPYVMQVAQSYSEGRGSGGPQGAVVSKPIPYQPTETTVEVEAPPLEETFSPLPLGGPAPQGAGTGNGTRTDSPGFGGASPAPAGSTITSYAPTDLAPAGGPSQGVPAQTGQGPSTDNLLQMLLGGANAGGGYKTQNVKDSYDWLGGRIDDQFDVQKQQLGEEMARRGLGASTIYGGRLNDLNIGQRSAKENLAYDLTDKQASSENQSSQNRLDYIRSLMGYGQQGFDNDMETARFDRESNDDFQRYIMQLLGLT